MNTAEDIKRMLGELVDEAIRIGKAEGKNDLGSEAVLKEQVKKLTEEKRNIVKQLDKAVEENERLQDTIDKLREILGVWG